jgi:glycosyltransferase involved in cell wall biosynthesis
MRIAFYAPFKPLDHPSPSGDRTIGRGLVAFLRDRGHDVTPVSVLRTRLISNRPWIWPAAFLERRRAMAAARAVRPDLWLTYHAYYKAPDILGPVCARALGLPYAIFQGIYSTRVKKSLATRAGFELNKRALLAADRVFTNKLRDLTNLRRLLPEERLTYAAPGIYPEEFVFSGKARRNIRGGWKAGRRPVIMTAAMFRDDVKTRGLVYLLERLGELFRKGRHFKLVIAGDGEMREAIHALARRELPDQVEFLGLVPRSELRFFYSASDLFVFPGINESLGMVFLEAQSVGLPVVAFDNDGLPEVVARNETGFLVEPFNDKAFKEAIVRLLDDKELRRSMGERAERRIRERHDLSKNYAVVEEQLLAMCGRRRVH